LSASVLNEVLKALTTRRRRWSVTGYARHKAQAAARQRTMVEEAQNIAPLPAVADSARRAKAIADFRFFSETYFAKIFYLPWSEDHLRAIGKIEQAVREGSLFAHAMPRASGKTMLAEAACLWAILGGYRPYVSLVAASAERAQELLRDIKTWLETNELLCADWPEGAIRAGLDALVGRLMNQEWRRDDGALLRIERLLIDANWGESTGLVYQFCRESPFGAAVMPSHGRGVSASQLPFSEYRRKAGDQVGHNWRVPGAKGRNVPRHVLFDTNYWKSFLHARLAVPHGDRGDLSLWGRKPEDHRLLAEHLTAEVPVKTQGRNRTVHEWKPRANAFDNHWFDCLVGCVVGAAMCGVTLPGVDVGLVRRRPRGRVRLSTLVGR
jgi:hypothetical protein